MNRKERRMQKSLGSSPALDAMFDTAFRHHQAGQLAEAGGLYNAILKENPNHADALHLLGLAHLQSNNPANAAELMRRAIQIAPERLLYYLNYGNALYALGKPDEALVQYKHLHSKDPSNVDAINNIANIYKDQYKLQDSATFYRKALALRPDFAEAHNNFALLLLDLKGDREEALQHFRQAIHSRPNYVEALTNYANTVSKDNPEEAITYYQKALQAQPNHLTTLSLLGRLLRRVGRNEEAIACFREYLRYNPADTHGVGLVLSQLLQQDLPDRVSQAYLEQTYTRRAGIWDKAIESKAEYHAPDLAADALRRWYKGEKPFTLLDAGCGTGLVGKLLRGEAGRMDGIDLSVPMLEQARAKRIYDDLQVGDMIAIMSACKQPYDAITCVATLLHFGDLLPALKASANALKQGGLLVFTTFYYDNEADPRGYAASQVEGSFMHSKSYIERIAPQAGLAIEGLETPMHERDRYGNPVTGLIVGLRKK